MHPANGANPPVQESHCFAMKDSLFNRRRFLAAGGCAIATAPVVAWVPSALAVQTGKPGSGTEPQQKMTLNVRDFGAAGDGSSKDTAALQQALDRCAALGGGVVQVPAGRYLTGSIALRTGTELRLEKGATLQGSPDPADYAVTQVRWEGKWIQGHVGLVYAIDAERVCITGPGQIAGDLEIGRRPTAQDPLRRPALIEFIRCRDLLLEGFSTSYHHMWSIHPTGCENIVIRGLTIRSTGGNGDGIDLDSCRHVRIEGCDISTGDDCISLKSGRGEQGYTLHQPTEDVLITDCTLADSIFACIGIGSETSGGIRGVRIERCRFTHARSFAIYIKSRVGRGAYLEDISATDLDASGMEGGFLRLNLLSSGLLGEHPVRGAAGIPRCSNFHFSRVRVQDCPVLVQATNISAEKPLDGFVLENVSGTCEQGIFLANVRNAQIRNLRVTGYAGPLITAENVTGTGLGDARRLSPEATQRQ